MQLLMLAAVFRTKAHLSKQPSKYLLYLNLKRKERKALTFFFPSLQKGRKEERKERKKEGRQQPLKTVKTLIKWVEKQHQSKFTVNSYGKLEKLRDSNYCHILKNYYEETLNNYSNSLENRETKQMHLSCEKKKLQLATK